MLSRVITVVNSMKHFTNFSLYLQDALGINERGKETTLNARDNYKITIRNQSIDRHIIAEIIFRDFYRLHDLDNSKIRTIIDVGAHIGVFSIYAASLFPEANIYAFEPENNNFARLKNNILQNNFNIMGFDYGLGSDNKEVELYLSTQNESGHSIYNFGASRPTQQIEIRTIESAWLENGISQCDLLKLDCEGAEYDIIYSLNEDMLSKISTIVGEIHTIDKEHRNIDNLSKYLKDRSFSVYSEKYQLMGEGIYLLKADKS